MKATLFFVIVSSVIAVIYSETCSNDRNCEHVSCSNDSRLACSRGQCTCLVAASTGTCLSETCSVLADCVSCDCRNSHVGSHAEKHCFHGHCLCGHAAVVGK